MRKLVLEFVDAINKHDSELVNSMITEDHIFIDSHGTEVFGKDEMKNAWIGYLNIFPDYKIEVNEVYGNGSAIVLLGFASGSLNGNKEDDPDCYWKLPAAWKAVVEEGKIKVWQVYADTKIPLEIINRFSKL